MKFSIIFVRNCISPTTRPMKRLSQLLLFISFAITANAQLQLDDFYTKGATWCQLELHETGHGVNWGSHPHYEIGDDTVFNGHTYHKFLMDYSSDMKGGIRVSNDTVFFVRTYDYGNDTIENYIQTFQHTPLNTETILYKFNLQVGDSLDWKSAHKTVTKIDTVYLSNGQPVRGYYFAGSREWIEGLGGTMSLFSSFMSYCPCSMTMVAYTNHSVGYNFVELPFNNSVYPITYYASECFPTSINNTQLPKSQFNIYPNPFTDNTLHITSIGIEKLSLADITGKIVYATSGIPSGDIALDIDLSPGMYILKAQLADGSIKMQKIVKQ